MPSNEEILQQMVRLDQRLSDHIALEEPVITGAKSLLDLHVDIDATRARIAFVNAWMEREKGRAELRRAIIEKTTIAAIWAVLVYMVLLVKEDFTVILKHWTYKP